MSLPQAFILLKLPNSRLTTNGTDLSGSLLLECVTVQLPNTSDDANRDVYLVLHISDYEYPLDPARIITRTDDYQSRIYQFYPTATDPNPITLSVKTVTGVQDEQANLEEDLETFENILSQYADFREDSAHIPASPNLGGNGTSTPKMLAHDTDDLRGRFILVNEESGAIIGEVEDKFRITEDPSLHEKGHENDPVIIEVPEETPAESDANAMELFVRTVPENERDWITQTAVVVSHAISLTTNLLLTTISSASNFYILRSKPNTRTRGSATPPSRAVVFLTSERAKKGLTAVHAVSSQAVNVSSKTVNLIDNMIRRAMGVKPQKGRTASPCLSPEPRVPSPEKPPLPPRKTPSPIPPVSPLPGSSTSPPPDGPKRLSTKTRILLSADLILSTVDNSTRQMLDAGTKTVADVMRHKYGAEAAENSILMANTARNAALVYVDMSGIGRRALLRRAGGHFIRGRFQK
ncbi:hypothetical protein AMATHDRAFT_73383 [Amanita thiersii Skay4041]|uniref:Senescence domain-containing protein n=1 Tax=Amanita thiersii Skay4041 TaxID=703135 RepID=A0A2A9NU13_9AGAR|nr:hypothetical protein AMATHDRAFT_73383 [Amanita thiersii Skay4041]